MQITIEKTHTSAVQVKYRADGLINANHYDPKSIREISDDVTKKWQQLVTYAEERHKLVTASINFYKTAERMHNESVTEFQNATYEVQQQGQDLLQLFENAGFISMADSTHTAQARIEYLYDFLRERAIDLEELAEAKRAKLDQAVQLCQFQNDANQVISWIRNGEAMLVASFVTPNSLQEAEQLRKEHEQFQVG